MHGRSENKMNQNEQDFLMGVAKLSAARSSAERLKVGGVVTDKFGNMVASGYNGTIRGFNTNVCEYYDDTLGRLVTDESTVVHAEQNLISHAARRGISIESGLVFLTHSPCTKCTSLLIQCGISEIIFEEKHRSFTETESLYGKYVILTQYKGTK
jgi:dCMP deaminase